MDVNRSIWTKNDPRALSNAHWPGHTSAQRVLSAAMLERVGVHGKEMSKKLKKLVDLKDKAQYGLGEVSIAEVKASIRALESLIDLAEKVRPT